MHVYLTCTVTVAVVGLAGGSAAAAAAEKNGKRHFTSKKENRDTTVFLGRSHAGPMATGTAATAGELATRRCAATAESGPDEHSDRA